MVIIVVSNLLDLPLTTFTAGYKLMCATLNGCDCAHNPCAKMKSSALQGTAVIFILEQAFCNDQCFFELDIPCQSTRNQSFPTFHSDMKATYVECPGASVWEGPSPRSL
eukprot:scaffold307681_cov15-Tisochrysis_lutea.AAC.1